MKSHIFISVGLTLALIFIFQGIEAIRAPGVGIYELYVVGGVVLALCVIKQGLSDRQSGE